MSMPESKSNSITLTRSLHLDAFVSDPAPRGTLVTNETEPGLTTFVKQAVADTVASGQRIILPRDAGALPAEGYLGTLSYCYAKEVYESADIEQKLHGSVIIRKLLGGLTPCASAIRRFRRLNRDVIRATLESAFRFRRAKDKALSGLNNPAAKTVDGEGTVAIVRKEAERRLENAVIIDSNSSCE